MRWDEAGRLGLRGKTIAILISTIVLAVSTILFGTRLFYQGKIEGLEAEEAKAALGRAEALVDDDLEQLDILVRDWAYWDDTWRFAESRASAYAEANLSEESLGALAVSALVIFGAKGETVFAGPPGSPKTGAIEAALRGPPLRIGEGRRGIVDSGGSLQIFVTRPILRSDSSGPVNGAIAMTRELDAARLIRYSRLSGIPVLVTPRTTGTAPAAAASVRLEPGSISASAPLAIDGAPAVADLSVRIARGDDRDGGRFLFIFFIGIALAVVLIGMLAVFAFEVAVLGRMRAIGAELKSIGAEKRVGPFLTVSGRDELTDLERAMNGTLGSFYAAIGERNAAIREIHHRVKNNIQLIASLVSLEASEARESETVSTLRDIGQRIQAIAFVHEELDIDREISSIDAGRLIDRIAMAIQQSDVGARGADVSIDCGGIGLDLESAVPVGLIVAEVIANAIVHAFPSGNAGEIRVAMAKRGEGRIVLSVLDDGVGIGAEAPRGLGMDIIDALSRQLRAETRYGPGSGGGTLFVMDFPAPSGEGPGPIE
jgi:two-component sensor histidine kinase